MLGAGRGIGLGFATALARRGFSLLLVDVREDLLPEAQRAAEAAGAPQVRTVAIDLAAADAGLRLTSASHDLDLGLAVVSAARSTVGPFLEEDLESHRASVRVNCDGTLVASHVLGRVLRARGRGGLILLSSLAGHQGTGWVAAYAATKAFDRVLAEALWWELSPHGVDVLALVAGSTDTPGFQEHSPRIDARSLQSAEEVAEEGLEKLGQGPVHVSGEANRRIFQALQGLPLDERIRVISENTRRLYRD